MASTQNTQAGRKRWHEIVAHEAFEYFFNFAFLAVFLVAFAWYRRLILAAYHIHYVGYWAPLIEAAILAKVIMIGDVLRIGRRVNNQPLAVVTIYRTVVFSVLVLLFSFLEHIVGALIHGRSAAEGIAEFTSKGMDELLAWYLLILVAFLPFFAMKEIERAFGAEEVRRRFFRRRADDIATSNGNNSALTNGQPK